MCLKGPRVHLGIGNVPAEKMAVKTQLLVCETISRGKLYQNMRFLGVKLSFDGHVLGGYVPDAQMNPQAF